MNSIPSSAAVAAPAAAPTAAEREARATSYLLAGALLLGFLLQTWIAPGGLTLVAGAGLAGTLMLVLSFVLPGRLRETISGFRFVASLLFVLAVLAVLGTLVLQSKPAGFYIARYGLAGKFIVALRLDDIFHGLPFALLVALFGAAVIASATLRWPVKARNLGFFTCHVGLITSLAGTALSATLAVRGRIDLHAGGETATKVLVTKAGQPTGELAALGFDLRLDKFDLVNYETEYRVGYFEQVAVEDEHGVHQTWQLKASFDPDTEKHRLPSGDSFQLVGIYPDFAPKPIEGKAGVYEYGSASNEWRNPAVLLEVRQQGLPKQQLMTASRPQGLILSPTSALVFERRAREAKAYVSHVTATKGSEVAKSSVSVNDPFTFAGWTFYQVNYRPEDPTYSGLEAVYDPGVAWVFTGFALISLGVFFMFYVEPRLKRSKKVPAASAAKA